MPSHQSVYLKREILERYGYYALDLGGPADYDWCIRYFYKNASAIKIAHIDEYILRFTLGGTSSSNLISKSKKRKDIYEECWQRNGYDVPKGIVWKKWLTKVKQYMDTWKYKEV